VRVDVIAPRKSDLRLVDAAARCYFDEMLAAGIHVHLYQPGLLHAKTLTIDRQLGVLGSANFDVRSFHLNVEANLLIYSPELAGSLCDLQEMYLQSCVQLDAAVFAARGRTRRLLDYYAKLFSPLF